MNEWVTMQKQVRRALYLTAVVAPIVFGCSPPKGTLIEGVGGAGSDAADAGSGVFVTSGKASSSASAGVGGASSTAIGSVTSGVTGVATGDAASSGAGGAPSGMSSGVASAGTGGAAGTGSSSVASTGTDAASSSASAASSTASAVASSASAASSSAASSSAASSTAIASSSASSSTGGPTFCTPATMIDDMEDGNNGLCMNQNRNGSWFTVLGAVAGATLSPAQNTAFDAWPLGPDARPGSNFGMSLTGTGFAGASPTVGFAFLGIALTNPNGPYNAAGFTGLSFYAKSKEGALSLRVNFETTESRDTGAGGNCVEPGCSDHWGQFVPLTATWTQYFITFQYTSQLGFGTVVPRNFAHMWNIDFLYGVNGANGVANPGNFEFLIDDVAFF